MAVSELGRLLVRRAIGTQTLAMHCERLKLDQTSSQSILNISHDLTERPSFDDVLAVTTQVQQAAEGKAMLIGGWGVRFYTDSPRPPSLDLDFIGETRTAMINMQNAFKMQAVPDWGCYVGYASAPSGQKIRLEVNPSDLISLGIWVNSVDQKTFSPILVGSPLTIASAKLARTVHHGPQTRDQVDIASLLLSQNELARQLKEQAVLDTRVSAAIKALDLPNSVQGVFSKDKINKLSGIMETLQFG